MSGSGRLFPDPLSSARRPNYIGWRERVRTGQMIIFVIARAIHGKLTSEQDPRNSKKIPYF